MIVNEAAKSQIKIAGKQSSAGTSSAGSLLQKPIKISFLVLSCIMVNVSF